MSNKWISLTKKDAPFATKLLIWLSDGSWCEATLEKKTENGNGKTFEFMHEGPVDRTITNATHYMIVEGPK